MDNSEIKRELRLTDAKLEALIHEMRQLTKAVELLSRAVARCTDTESLQEEFALYVGSQCRSAINRLETLAPRKP